ncbi:hypothetical protein ACTXT7_012432 [Hymenolepis weldensis]
MLTKQKLLHPNPMRLEEECVEKFMIRDIRQRRYKGKKYDPNPLKLFVFSGKLRSD